MNPEHGLKILRQFQELLSGGDFTATYKFALLQALADISVELDAHSDGSLTIAVDELAEKFIEYYWNQVRPFRGGAPLLQNHHRQAAIVRLIEEHRAKVADTIKAAQREHTSWRSLRSAVAKVITDQPLWKLQIIGSQAIEFLYRRVEYRKRTIRLLPGVADALKAFHPMVTGMIRSGWIQHIHRIKNNREILGPGAELEEFLFGVDRGALSRYREVFNGHQQGRCFYCNGLVRNTGELDHFIPWSRYPTDLGHNFVYAHSSCNQSKRDHLAATSHLERWKDQNVHEGPALARRFEDAGLLHDLERSHQIAWWAYEQAHATQAPLWVADRIFEPCDYKWREVLAPRRDAAFEMAADKDDPPDSGEPDGPDDSID